MDCQKLELVSWPLLSDSFIFTSGFFILKTHRTVWFAAWIRLLRQIGNNSRCHKTCIAVFSDKEYQMLSLDRPMPCSLFLSPIPHSIPLSYPQSPIQTHYFHLNIPIPDVKKICNLSFKQPWRWMHGHTDMIPKSAFGIPGNLPVSVTLCTVWAHCHL